MCFRMAFARHGAIGTAASAGGSAFSFIPDHGEYNSSHDKDDQKCYQYRSDILRYPGNHMEHLLFCGMSNCQLVCFLVLLEEQHVYDQAQYCYCKDQAYHVEVASKGVAELVDHERDGICENALVKDRESRPLWVVHLTLDGADRCKAWCAQEIEYQEGHTGYNRESLRESLPCGQFAAAVKNAHRSDDVLFCDKTGYRSDGSLPVTPAQRSEYPCDDAADLCKDGEIKFFFLKHPEAVFRETEEAREPDDDR